MPDRICAVAVDAATFAIDKLYTYILPAALQEGAQVGCRVLVPFGRASKRAEGIILAFRDDASRERLKAVDAVLDDEPVLSAAQIRLAVWMRERLYCTFYDCIRVILPTGLWLKRNDTYTLCVEDANALEALKAEGFGRLLAAFEEQPSRTLDEIRQLLGGRTPAGQLDALCRRGILVYDSKITQRTQDKTEQMYHLALDPQEALARETRARRSAVRQDVIACLADGQAMSKQELQYMTGVSDGILRTMVKNSILETFAEERMRVPDYSDVSLEPPKSLTVAQQQVYEGLRAQLMQSQSSVALLHGVTGSGKTQIYLNLIDDVLAEGQSAIVLVPEIGLTPQFIRVFAQRFGGEVTVLHSALSAGERYDSWKKIRAGAARVVIGTRSAVFAPVKNLGLLVIDEEQDGAYQSDQSPRYHARDVARFIAHQQGALLLLGSATPSVESYYYAQQGRYALFHLPERFGSGGLPQVTIADMRGLSRKGLTGSIGPILREEIAHNLAQGEQTILFLNRRGNSRVIGCTMCGWVPECPSCSTTMTYHSVNGRAMCHYCGASIKVQEFCPSCGSAHLFLENPGTQRVEQELHELFPEARVLRMDADTTSTKNAHTQLLQTFGEGQADILLGTQMVTKGLDFERVTLVGVLDADQSLYAQDFRARERTFSLITQVVGRAGRREAQGRAIIQTFSPEHPVILTAARQDYAAFYEQELESRRAMQCPPIRELLLLSASGEQEQDVLAALLRLKTRLAGLMEGQFADFKYPVLGPAAASIVRIAGRYRYHLTIRCPDNKRRRQLIAGVMREFAADRRNRGVHLFANLNPDTM
ncbi:replication restart helicase PriA [Intestinibacillus sp. Marseille-P6563]|uniref:replication restart helicase PriA n=1 Tax=Intestinibacillus sp. Marseille-P6563 TaxID=2364792 RepID=UPI000F060853|nr:primosomal protein N' [Intestinibacillus sp. Marseille-P6563]